MFENEARRLKICFIMLVVIISVGMILGMKPVSQDVGYHAFADDAKRFGVVNANDVISNAGFIIAGIVGLMRLRSWPSSNTIKLWRFFFFSVILVGFGSAYYHLRPSNTTLIWDRLPMTLGFAALTSCLFAERLGVKMGHRLFGPLAASGMLSVIYWWITEQAGAGDLRPYILVQYLPMVLIPLILLLFPKSSGQNKFYWLLFSSYLAAKFFEINDIEVFHLTHQVISGHTIKHLAAATGILLFRPAIGVDADNSLDRSTIIS